MSTVTNDADTIRREMARIRREMRADAQGVVASAEAATDWRQYLTAYPWASLGVAFAVGYFVVPRKMPTVDAALAASAAATRAEVSQVREAVDSAKRTISDAAGRAAEPKNRGKTLVGAALGLIVPLALRAAQGYALKYVEQWIAQQQLNLQGGPPFAHEGGPARPTAGPGYGSGVGPRPRPSGGPGTF